MDIITTILGLMITVFVQSEGEVTSCFQNYTFTSGFFNRDYFSAQTCPSSSLNESVFCARFDGRFHTLLGPSSGNVVMGKCLSRSECQSVNCAEFATAVTRINPPFARIEACNITCCDSDNCNGGISQYVINLPSITSPNDDATPPHDMVSTSDVSVNSCYQNYTFTSGFFIRDYLAEETCPYNSTISAEKTVCVRFEGKWHTLLGPNSGTTVLGDCMPLAECRALNCSDYVSRIKRINPLFFRLESCEISCCDSDNCNYAEIKPLTTTTTTQPLTLPTPAARRENITELSCYQGHLLLHDLRQQNTMEPRACDITAATEPLACVRVEAFVDLVGVEGIVDIGACVPASTCRQLDCEDFERERFAINPLARLSDCFVDCCTTDNCNNGAKMTTSSFTFLVVCIISLIFNLQV